MAYNEIEPTERHPKRQSISSITKNNPDAIRVSKEIRIYAEEDILKTVEQKIKDLYSEFRDVVLNLGSDVTIKATKNYITLRRKISFMGIHFTKFGLRIDFHARLSELHDPKHIAKPVSNGDWSVLTLSQPADIPYVLSLVKLAYDKSY